MKYKVLKGDIWTQGKKGGSDIRHTTGDEIELNPSDPDTKAFLKSGKIIPLDQFNAAEDADSDSDETTNPDA